MSEYSRWSGRYGTAAGDGRISMPLFRPERPSPARCGGCPRWHGGFCDRFGRVREPGDVPADCRRV